jgi:hypothetical protein
MGIGNARNKPCPCGSGKKIKHCHGADATELVPIDLRRLSEQQRWLLLADEVQDILGLPDGFGGSELRSAFDRRHVPEINSAYHQIIGQYSTELRAPRQSDTKLGALYLGDIQERRLRSNVMRLALYADIIYVVDPFISPHVNFSEDSGSAATNPDNFVLSTYQAVYFLLRMRPWIQSGILHLLPNPIFIFNDYREYVLKAAKEHADKVIDQDELKKEFRDAFFEMSVNAEMFAGVPDDRLMEAVKSMFGSAMPEHIAQSVVQIVQQERAVRLDVPRTEAFAERVGQINLRRGGMDPISTAMICTEINAFPYTERRTRLKLIDALFEGNNAAAQEWAPLAQAFAQIEMKFLNEVSSDFAIGLRQDGRLQSFRSLLRRIWAEIDSDTGTTPSAVLSFSDELRGEYEVARGEWETIRVDAVKMGLSAAGLFAAGAFALNLPTFLSAGGTLVGAYEHWRKAKSFRAKNPASVLIDLKKRENRD